MEDRIKFWIGELDSETNALLLDDMKHWLIVLRTIKKHL